MSNRTYRLLFGTTLLLTLYFDQYLVIYIMIGLALAEAVTNIRIPSVISRIRYNKDCDPCEGSLGIAFKARTNFEAERGWRIAVSAMLLISLLVYPQLLWFFPWFMGFAVMGAGISGVCPVFLGLKWAGLK